MIHATRPNVPEQTPIVQCPACKRTLATTTTALLESGVGQRQADDQRRRITRCPDCGDLDQAAEAAAALAQPLRGRGRPPKVRDEATG